MGDELPDQFKQLGPEALRTLMQSGGIPANLIRSAARWLAEMDEEEKRQNLANQTFQIRMTWITAIAAIAAALISFLAWMFPIH